MSAITTHLCLGELQEFPVSEVQGHFVCIAHSAFDTLAKVFNPPDVGFEENLAGKSQCVSGTTIQLIGRDQETPIIEVEGPLLTDSHVSFKVGKAHA